MTTVNELLRYKGAEIVTIDPDAMVYDALALMSRRNIGALLVLEKDRLVGVFSERDYARKVILQGRSSKTTAVREIMSERFVAVKPNTPVDECMGIMTEKRIRHLPVLDGDKLIGVVSIGDVVRAVIDDREFTIQQLERYICCG
jgi:CBS domain-containing protein